jgi:hypothetical protein
MGERERLNIVLAIAAVAVLVGSGIALAMATSPHGNRDVIIVNGQEFYWGTLQDDFSVVEFEANGVQYEGVRISDLVNSSGLASPEAYDYELVSARDGYSKTLAWGDMLNGYLVMDFERRAVFPERTKSFWVDSMGEINPIEG